LGLAHLVLDDSFVAELIKKPGKTLGKSNKAIKKRILFIGRKNVGKSLLIDIFLGKDIHDVNYTKRSVTDLTEIPMELPPYGSVTLIDTVPIDETSPNEQNIISKVQNAVPLSDFVVFVIDAREKLSQKEKYIFQHLKNSAIPFLAAVNKIEFGINSELINNLRALNITHFEISCKENVGIDALKSRITRLLQLEPTNNSKI
jgi:GTP-binding protein